MTTPHLPMVDIPEKDCTRSYGVLTAQKAAQRIALPLQHVNIQAKVIAQVAEVTVSQKFRNHHEEALEAVYIFPLTGGSAVSSFEMKVGDRILRGQVEERTRARQHYQNALQEGKRSALLEQERDDVFTVQVGNIPPDEEIEIKITYSERLPFFENGTTEIRLPMVVAPRYVPGNPLDSCDVGDGIEEDTDIVPDASRISPPRLAKGFDSKVGLSIEVELSSDMPIHELACSQHATRTSNSEKTPRKRNLIRAIILTLVAVLILAAVTAGIYLFQTRNVEEQILTGKYQEATNDLNHWTWLPFVNDRIYEALGTIQLLKQGGEAAHPYFAKAISKPVGIWIDVLKTLWVNGRYSDGLVYASHIERNVSDSPMFRFYKAGFLAGENQLPEASTELQKVGNAAELKSEVELLKSEIEQRTWTGNYAFITDRENLPLVKMSFKGKEIFLSESIRLLLANSDYNLVDELKKTALKNSAILTLDNRMQNAAQRALENYGGAIVLLDVNSGDILAAASNPPSTSLAMSTDYEPGSIIKMITLAGAIEHNVDLSKIVPFQCDAYITLNGVKTPFCYKPHGEMKDMNQASAVSCNVAFARIGLLMKPDDLISNLKQFGFDSKLTEMLPVELGKIKQGTIDDRYISDLSIGLEQLEITPLHAAMIASAIANQGICMTPRLVSCYRNIVGLPFKTLPSQEFRRLMSQKTSQAVTQAMLEVVKNQEGTGRRAALPSFPIAIKTGTAGKAATGYNAIVIGFGPVPNPTIAFAIFLEHAGKAEFEGARITRLFLESIQGYI